MGVQERKARDKEELRQEILDAATDLFVEQGYEAVSMRKIAEKIEYSPTTIYLHFRDKNDLLDSICGDTFNRLVDILGAIDEADPVENLRKGCRAYIQFGLDHPAHYRVTFMMPDVTESGGDEPCKSEEAGDRAFACLVGSVSACIKAGYFRCPDPKLTSEMIWSAMHGLVALLITWPQMTWSPKETLIDELLTTLIEGCRTRGI